MKYCGYCLMANPDDSKFCERCGKSFSDDVPSYHLAVGTVLNYKYIVGRAIGEGGFGITYIGKDTKLDMTIAVKEFYPNGYVNRTNTVSATVNKSRDLERKQVFDKGLRRFLDEARALAKFSGTNGIVDVRDFFEENNTAYIVMEYLDGQTLKTFLTYNGRLSDRDTVDLLMPIMKSLGKIHQEGLIHRDISPDNIMLMEGNVKLLDFGAVRDVSSSGTKSLTVTLKHGYAPEEQYREHGEQGPWTDVYALCATIYVCVTGKIPDNAVERMVKDNVLWPTEMGVSIHPGFEKVLMKGLNIYAKDRYQTVGELIDAIIASDLYGNNEANETGGIQKEKKKISVLKVILPVSIALAVAMIVIGIVFTLGKKEDSEIDTEARMEYLPEDQEETLSDEIKNEVTEVQNNNITSEPVNDTLSNDFLLNEDSSTINLEDNEKDLEEVDNIVTNDESKVERVSQIKDHTVKDLRLDNIKLYKEDINDLLNCFNLKAIYFKNCEFDSGCFDILVDKTMDIVSLSIEDCTGIDNYKWISNKINLKNLRIKNSGLNNELFSQINFTKLNIEILDISDNPLLTDISNVSACTGIKNLCIDNDSISDISFFYDIKNLQIFSANNNYLKSLKGLETAIRLIRLSAAGNALTNIDGIKNCTLLIDVNLNDNYLTEIGNISKSKETIVTLYFNNNNVTSIKPLKNCEKLENLSFSNNQVTELKHLSNMKNLISLNVSHNLVESLDSLKECTNLVCLCASGNNISVCDYLPVFAKGEKTKNGICVDISDNKISNMGNLVKKSKSCEAFVLYGNPITKYDFLGKIHTQNLFLQYNKSLLSKDLDIEYDHLYVMDCPLDKEVKLKTKYTNSENLNRDKMQEMVENCIYSNHIEWFGVSGERKENKKKTKNSEN